MYISTKSLLSKGLISELLRSIDEIIPIYYKLTSGLTTVGRAKSVKLDGYLKMV